MIRGEDKVYSFRIRFIQRSTYAVTKHIAYRIGVPSYKKCNIFVLIWISVKK